MSEFQIGDVVKVTGNRGEDGTGTVHYFEDGVIATVKEDKDFDGDYYVTDYDEGTTGSSFERRQFVNEHNLERLPFQPGEKVLVRRDNGLRAFDGEPTKAEVIEFGGWRGDSIEDRRRVVALDDRDWTQVVHVRDMETLPLFERGDKVRVIGDGNRENDRIRHGFMVGDVGEVTSARDSAGDYLVMVGSLTNYVHESHLEKVEDEDEQTLDIGRMKDEPSTYPLLDLPNLSVSGPLSFADVSEAGVTLDVVNPPHYRFGLYEVIDVIEDWGLDYHRGNVIKYVARAGRKDPATEVQDLEKARWYITRAIEQAGG